VYAFSFILNLGVLHLCTCVTSPLCCRLMS